MTSLSHAPKSLEPQAGRASTDDACEIAAEACAALACAALACAVAAFNEEGVLRYANTLFRERFQPGAARSLRLREFEAQFQPAAPSPTAVLLPVDAGDWLHHATGRWYAASRSVVQSGKRQLAVVQLWDVTQRLADEHRQRSQHQQLLFTSKVMSVGEMAATLAHELNQPIGSVLNFLNGCVLRLERGTATPADLHAPLIEARQQCIRAAEIIMRIRQFVRAREPQPMPIALPEVFSSVVSLLASDIKLHRIAVAVEASSSLPAVRADRVMLEQVVHNLVKNAIDAMRSQNRQRRLVISACINAAGLVQTAVQDSGPGVTSDARGQLFSPFFTTKADGLGIGLNICRSMLEFHGGALFYEEAVDGGSRFCFTLHPHEQPGERP